MQSTGVKQHECQSSPQDVRTTRGVLEQRQSLVCSAPTCALHEVPFLAPCLLLTQKLHAAGYPCARVYIWSLLDNDLPRRPAVTSLSPCHLKAGISCLVIREEAGDEGPTCDQAMNSPSSVAGSQGPAPGTQSPAPLT